MTDEQILQFYEGRDNPFNLEKVIETYKPIIIGSEPVKPCLISYKNAKIGYLQYYSVAELPEIDQQKYCLDNTDKVYGIDLFIGEPNYWHRGIGSEILRMVIRYIFEVFLAALIVVDPRVDNIRAIRCYEKCGFVKVKLLPVHELHEGKYSDCWLMVIEGNKSLH
ncbi:GNAT family N-acetyltransferase [Anabaena sp. CCY 9910]|uniref:GNAT family N-acetyltransferase n=1 Tax=Anabaena sp. CCY 9910 TaxID=3103870 RepID=UPI0039DF4AD3